MYNYYSYKAWTFNIVKLKNIFHGDLKMYIQN